MQLTTKGRYAVMAMLDLALHQDQGAVSIAEIALRQDISPLYLEQLFAKLRGKGLVRGVRGPGGGYCLERPAMEIIVADIISAVNENMDVTRCGGKGNCQGGKQCLTHELWNNLSDQLYTFLSQISLGQLTADSTLPGQTANKQLCAEGGLQYKKNQKKYALAARHCTPYEGSASPLTSEAARNILQNIDNNWTLNEGYTEINRTFHFKDFYQTMAFVNALAWIAHGEDHHPNLEVSYNRCHVRYSTHAIGGLSDNDFISAAKVDTLVEYWVRERL